MGVSLAQGSTLRLFQGCGARIVRFQLRRPRHARAPLGHSFLWPRGGSYRASWRRPGDVRAEASPGGQEGGQGPKEAPRQVPEWVLKEIARYDASVEKAREAVRKQQEDVDNFSMQVDQLEAMGAPRWILGGMGWLRGQLTSMLRLLEERTEKMQAGRDEFLKELTELARVEEGLKAQQQHAAEGGAGAALLSELAPEQLRIMQEPGTLAGLLMFQCLAVATVVTGLGSLAGADAGALTWPVEDLPGALGSWAVWTGPYLGVTLLAGTLLPSLGPKRVLRGSNANSKLFAELGPTSLVLLAVVAATSQAVVFQGTWLHAALDFYRGGGGGAATDPALLEENLRGSLGSLVVARGVALLASPLAVLSVALLEGGWWAAYTTAEAMVPQWEEELSEEGLAPELDSWASLHKQYMDETPVQGVDLALQAGRIFCASAYLSSEALACGSVWYAAGTSTVGLLAAMLLARRQGRAAGAKE